VERAQNAQTIDLLKGAGATMPEFPEEKKNNLLIEYASSSSCVYYSHMYCKWWTLGAPGRATGI
jgi:hypothetical protein